jgi:predicted helicase
MQKRYELNRLIGFPVGGRLDFSPFASSSNVSLTVLSLDANQCLPQFRYDSLGNRAENITDWGLNVFQTHYKTFEPEPSKAAWPSPDGVKRIKDYISKEDIFHYVYAVLHNPAYREKYAQNLKREFPRVPLYGKSLKDFERWANWGAALMALHIDYETVAPFDLQRVDIPMKTADNSIKPKAKLKADKDAGKIIIDEVTTLSGIPPQAWAYKLGNRSALEWVLDQYKESKPKDPTIREQFDTYRFADYKDHVIDLLQRVCAVSIQTQAIIEQMTQG